MFIYNPHNERILQERVSHAEELLQQIPAKYCFITGSFLHKEKYEDIDLFVISRTSKQLTINNPKARITVLDFNDLYSLFYHSVSKSCIAKTFLPQRLLKVTLADYWQVVNEAIPTLFNEKDQFHKSVRFLILYTEYFKTGEVLDSFQLAQTISRFTGYQDVLAYVKQEIPGILNRKIKSSYAKRFFYTQAGHYKSLRDYAAQSFLYHLTHQIIAKHINNVMKMRESAAFSGRQKRKPRPKMGASFFVRNK